MMIDDFYDVGLFDAVVYKLWIRDVKKDVFWIFWSDLI